MGAILIFLIQCLACIAMIFLFLYFDSKSESRRTSSHLLKELISNGYEINNIDINEILKK